MMRVYITGSKGFIGRNLVADLKDHGHTVLGDDDLIRNNATTRFYRSNLDITDKLSTWKSLLQNNNVDVVVHNAAIVGTDVCAMYPEKTFNTNVFGTYNIAMACRETHTPIIYIGTTVIYGTDAYQKTPISEESQIAPRTLYAKTKFEGECYVRDICKPSRFCIMRPLFCYGGIGDMNSLIAKSIFNYQKNKDNDTEDRISIFLDPYKSKDYMHVSDFVWAIRVAIENNLYRSNEDFNISVMNPMRTQDIAYEIDHVLGGNSSQYIDWFPKTDYLGNHLAFNGKFKHYVDNEWNPIISVREGAEMFLSQMMLNKDEDYDPLEHLNKIKEDKVDIEKFYK